MFKRLGTKGDTIVEVLIAIGVVGLVLAAAYATSRRSYLTMQDTQEYGIALRLLESQAEALKAYNNEHHDELVDYVDANRNLCMSVDATGQIVPALPPNLETPNSCSVDSSGVQASAGLIPTYTLRIGKVDGVSIGAGKQFELTATWESGLGNGQNKARLEYGLY